MAPPIMSPKQSKAAAAALIGFCIVAALGVVDVGDGDLLPSQFADNDDGLLAPPINRQLAKQLTPRERQRYLRDLRREKRRELRRRKAARERSLAKPTEPTGPSLSAAAPSGLYLWAEKHLAPVAEPPRRSSEGAVKEVPIFWHIPKSGGTTAEDVYQCLGQTISNREGALPRFGHDKDTELHAFQPWSKWGVTATYVNTDTTSTPGILKAKQLGLVSSGMVDIIFVGDPAFAIEHLYDESHRGRAMALFRHPVDRLNSKFYYLQVADWERTYAPHWKKLSMSEWATRVNNDNNFLVKKLAGKKLYQTVGETDLQLAIKTVKERFVVGLMEDMEESIRRFNVVVGVDESTKENQECLGKFFGDHVEKKNSNSHPKLAEGDPGWAVLAEKNALDIRLYEHIRRMYNEQASIIESYRNPCVDTH